MYFGLTDEQELLQETVRGFIDGECPPTRLRELFDAKQGHESSLWHGLAEMGIAGLVVPESYGGAGLELLELALVSEVIGGGALPGPFLGHSLACLAVAQGGDDAQRERWLPALASGDAVGTVALCEGGESWEPEDWAASCEGNVLAGVKRYVPFGDEADLIVVGTTGGGLAVVEKGAHGVESEAVETIDRTRPVVTLRFDGAPAEPLTAGTRVAPRVRDAGLVALAADALGVATRLTAMSAEYAKTREQFGTPIAQFQAIKHQLANMATESELARGLYWYAAYVVDHQPEDAEREAAIAKAHVTDRACDVAREAVQVHGGLGFTWECDVQIWFKRAMFDRAFLGTPAHHRTRSAALEGW